MVSVKLLALGQSSVSESKWFLVGLGHSEVFLIICNYGGEIEEQEKWHVVRYRPGMDWNDEKEVFGQANELLIETCQKDTEAKNLNWNDDKLASEIYWNYVNNK